MASKGVNKVILIDLYQRGQSIPQVSKETGVPLSTVRYHLSRAGVLRNRSDGVRMAGAEGRLGSWMRGKRRVFTEQHKQNISKAKLNHALSNAVGVSVKPNGYVEVTTGEYKGRGLHRVIAEGMIGRPLTKDEVVHHIDGNRSNNEPSNLEVMSHSEHCRHHALEREIYRQRDDQGRYI